MYDFRLDDVARWIIERGAQTIALQMPEGLKVHAQRLGRELESRTGCKCVLIADPCYGACDVDRRFNEYADVLIQFGHADIPSMKVGPNILFVEVFIDLMSRNCCLERSPCSRARLECSPPCSTFE